jgi:hypothetical protein
MPYARSLLTKCPRDIVFVPMWCSNCEDFPEHPSLRGWIEAMTTLVD